MILAAGASSDGAAARGIGGGDSGEHRESGSHVVVGQFVILGADEFGNLEERSCLAEPNDRLCAVAVLRPARRWCHRGITSPAIWLRRLRMSGP
jgi:hypothetical protein